MELTRACSWCTKCFDYYLNVLDWNIILIYQRFFYLIFNSFCKWLRQVSTILERIHQITQLFARKLMKHRFQSRQHHFKQCLWAAHTKQKSTTDFLNVSFIQICNPCHYCLFHYLEEILCAESRYGKGTRTSCHLIDSHLV